MHRTGTVTNDKCSIHKHAFFYKESDERYKNNHKLLTTVAAFITKVVGPW